MPTLSPSERIAKAVRLALQYGPHDGAEHKMWTLDQVVRILTGPDYRRTILASRHGWDVGTPP